MFGWTYGTIYSWRPEMDLYKSSLLYRYCTPSLRVHLIACWGACLEACLEACLGACWGACLGACLGACSRACLKASSKAPWEPPVESPTPAGVECSMGSFWPMENSESVEALANSTSATTLVSVRNTRVFRMALTALMERRTLWRRITRYPSPRRRVALRTYSFTLWWCLRTIRRTRVLHSSEGLQLCSSRLHNAWQC